MSGAAALLFAAALIVIDGDTIRRADTGERLRLEAIDAPEIGRRAECREEERLAERAKARLAEIVAAGVRIEGGERRDRYGRPLVRLRAQGGETAGAILIAEGLAQPWRGRKAEWCNQETRIR